MIKRASIVWRVLVGFHESDHQDKQCILLRQLSHSKVLGRCRLAFVVYSSACESLGAEHL